MIVLSPPMRSRIVLNHSHDKHLEFFRSSGNQCLELISAHRSVGECCYRPVGLLGSQVNYEGSKKKEKTRNVLKARKTALILFAKIHLSDEALILILNFNYEKKNKLPEFSVKKFIVL